MISPTLEPQLDSYLKSLALELRPFADLVDRDPSSIKQLLHLEATQLMACLGLPNEFTQKSHEPFQNFTGDIGRWRRFGVYFWLAYGDVNLLLASPGPVMTGAVINRAAAPDLRERFWSQISQKPTWTFFALTEPQVGSDATAINSVAEPTNRGFLLTGEKTLVGAAHFASLGVVFARPSKQALQPSAFLVERQVSDVRLHTELIPTLGARGALLSKIRFEKLFVPSTHLLGVGNSPIRSFSNTALQAFALFRPCVAAMALGLAYSALEPFPGKFPQHWLTLNYCLKLAATILNSEEPTLEAISILKSQATQLAEQVTADVVQWLGPRALMDHPRFWLLYRNARCFEYMEGTMHIHRLAAWRGFETRRFEVAGA